MRTDVAVIASTDTQEVSTRQLQSARQENERSTRSSAETAAGTAAAADVALQRNQNAARVEAELQRQLTATQASNASRIDGQNGVSRPDAVQPTPVTVAPAQTVSRQQQAADNARAAENRNAQRRQDDAQRSARAQADRDARQAEQSREPAATPASAAREYRNNQNLLQPAGSNTRRVISSA